MNIKNIEEDSEIYGLKYKEQLNIIKIRNNYRNKNYDLEDKLYLIYNDKLSKKIRKLPEDLQKKIYIFRMKKYNKYDYINPINKIPMWYEHKIDIEKQISRCYLENIHFLHLDMNTLPENKKYILGCQCNFCKNYENKSIYNKYISNVGNIKFIDEDVFIKFVLGMDDYHYTTMNYWNRFDDYDGQLSIFNPLYDEYLKYFKIRGKQFSIK